MHEYEGQNKTSTRGVVMYGSESENKCHEGSVFLETISISRESGIFLKTKVHTKGIEDANKYENIMK